MTSTPPIATASVTVGDAAEVIAHVDMVDADALLRRVVGVLYGAAITDGAVQLDAGNTPLLADPTTGEVWAGEAVDNADAALRHGIAYIAAAIAAGATI